MVVKGDMMKIREIDETVRQRTLDLFDGDEQMSEQWLTTPKVIFSNVSPLDVLSTHNGKSKILKVIEKIQHGDLS